MLAPTIQNQQNAGAPQGNTGNANPQGQAPQGQPPLMLTNPVGGQQNPQGQQNQQNQQNQQPELDPDEADFQALLEDFGGIDETLNQQEQEAQKLAQQQQLQGQPTAESIGQALQASINGFSIPQSLFENVDFSDPATAHKAMNAIMKPVLAQSVQQMVPLLEAAIKQQTTHLMGVIESKLKGGLRTNTDEQTLKAEFPLISDPVYAPIFRPMVEHMRKANKPVAEQIRNLKLFARRMNLDTRSGSQNSGENQMTVTGTDALDVLFKA